MTINHTMPFGKHEGRKLASSREWSFAIAYGSWLSRILAQGTLIFIDLWPLPLVKRL